MGDKFLRRWTVALCLTVSMLAGSSAPAQQCVADCDADGSVGVSELIRCVRIALGRAVLESCPECDPNDDGNVGIAELVTAVGHALCNCEICPTPAATRTPTPTRTPLPATATPVAPTKPPSTPTVSTPACDFNGSWDGESTTVRDTCDEEFGTERFSITIRHGADGVLTEPDGFTGATDTSGGNCCLNFVFLEPDEGGVSCNVGRVCKTADGRQFTGSIEWKFFERPNATCSDNDFECSGTESLTATRR